VEIEIFAAWGGGRFGERHRFFKTDGGAFRSQLKKVGEQKPARTRGTSLFGRMAKKVQRHRMKPGNSDSNAGGRGAKMHQAEKEAIGVTTIVLKKGGVGTKGPLIGPFPEGEIKNRGTKKALDRGATRLDTRLAQPNDWKVCVH